jgi:hypothetical protein
VVKSISNRIFVLNKINLSEMDMDNNNNNNGGSSSGSVFNDSNGRRSHSKNVHNRSSSRSRSRSNVRGGGSSSGGNANNSNVQRRNHWRYGKANRSTTVMNDWNFEYTDVMYVSTIDELTKPLIVNVKSGEYNVRILKDEAGIGYVLCLKDKPIEGMKNVTNAFTGRSDNPGFKHFGPSSDCITNKHILKLVRNYIFKYFNVEPHHIETLQEELEYCDDDDSEEIYKENYNEYSAEKLKFIFINLMLQTKAIPFQMPIIFYLNVQLDKHDLKNIKMFDEHVYRANDNCYVYWKVYCGHRQIGIAIQQNEIIDFSESGHGGVLAYSEDKKKAYALGNCAFDYKNFDELFENALERRSLLYNRETMYE